MARLLFIHGWAEGPSIWHSLKKSLPKDQIECIDLGFYGQPYSPGEETVRDSVIVGHSLGFLYGLREWAPEAKAFVSINGFSRFSSHETFPSGVHPRVIQRMIKGMESNPDKVVRDFLKKCGTGMPGETGTNTSRLTEGLEWLRDWDSRDILSLTGKPVLALASTTDPIVSDSMTAACFEPSAIRWSDTGTHMLPQVHPDWCAAEITAFLAAL